MNRLATVPCFHELINGYLPTSDRSQETKGHVYSAHNCVPHFHSTNTEKRKEWKKDLSVTSAEQSTWMTPLFRRLCSHYNHNLRDLYDQKWTPHHYKRNLFALQWFWETETAYHVWNSSRNWELPPIAITLIKNIKVHDVLYVGNYTEKTRILLFSWGKWTLVQPLWEEKKLAKPHEIESENVLWPSTPLLATNSEQTFANP